MVDRVVEQCGECGAGFTNWRQRPPCGMECPFHRDFRVRETKISESIRVLSKPPKHGKCGGYMVAIDIRTAGGAHLAWKCPRCNLLFEVGERTG